MDWALASILAPIFRPR